MLHLLPELTLIEQDTIAGAGTGISEGLSSVICWGEERVEDEAEIVSGQPQMAKFPGGFTSSSWASILSKSRNGFGVPCFVCERP